MRTGKSSLPAMGRAVADSNAPTFAVDAQGTTLFCNLALEKRSGFTERELLGRPLPVFEPHVLTEWIKVAQERPAALHETDFLKKDGARERVLVCACGARPEKGRPAELLGVVMDGVEGGRVHREWIQAEKTAAVRTLARGIAHEFNNLHGVLKGLIEINLRNKDLPPALRADLETMRQTTARAVDITEKLSAFARRKPSARAPADLNSIVTGLLTLLRGDLEAEGILVTVTFSQDALVLPLNEALISQVILDLLTNARQAMATSPVKKLGIETGLVGDWGMLRVRDTGCGLTEADQERIFDPFFTKRESSSGAQRPGSRLPLGLGLSVCRSIAEEHGGRMEVTSRPGEGAVFTLWLSCAEAQAGGEETAPPSPRRVR